MTQREHVTGDKLAVGDIVINHGYRWKLTSVGFETMSDGASRYYVSADEAPAPGFPPVPRGFAKNMSMALRSDLTWLREVK